MESKYEKAVLRKLTKELGSHANAIEYFASNENFMPTSKSDDTPNICSTCNQEYKVANVYSCTFCKRAFKNTAGVITAGSKVNCPSCGAVLATKKTQTCECGTSFSDEGGSTKQVAAERLASYLGREMGGLDKQASVQIQAAKKDDEVVAWGDCIVDQYAEGYSVDESVKVCGIIKRQVVASMEEASAARKIVGTTKLVLSQEFLDNINDDRGDVVVDDSGMDDVVVVDDAIGDEVPMDVIDAPMGDEMGGGIGDELGPDNGIVIEVKFSFDPDTQDIELIGVETESEEAEIMEDMNEVSEEIVDISDIGDMGGDGLEEVQVEDSIEEAPMPMGGGDDIEVIMETDEEAPVEASSDDLVEIEEITDFDENMISGTNLDISDEEKEGKTSEEITEARKVRVAGIVNRQRERQAALDIVDPSNQKALGDDTSNDPQAGNTDGPAPKMVDQSGTQKAEPKKEITKLEGENSLESQNNSVDANKPIIPTQRELEIQDTAVQQKERQTFEGEAVSEQMKPGQPSYDLASPDIPVSKTTPHDNEDYSQEELAKPKIPTQTEVGKYELEFVAADERIKGLENYADRVKKASKVATMMLSAGVIQEEDFDNRVEQLASGTEEMIDVYLEDISILQHKEAEINSRDKEVTAGVGATVALFTQQEQSYQQDEAADEAGSLSGMFSVTRGSDQKAISVSEFRQKLTEDE